MRIYILLACILTVITMPTKAKQPLNFEITPLIGYRFGGDFDTSRDAVHSRVELSEETSYGLLAAWSFDRKRQGEFLISHYNSSFSQTDDFSVGNSDLSITYAHLGGNVPIADGAVPIYVAGGFGLNAPCP